MDAIQLLFEDVTQLPIITSSIQELWLGIQIKAPQTWAELDLYDDQTLLAAIYASMRMRFSEIERKCIEAGIAAPKIEVWIVEAQEVYYNIYATRNSDFYRFTKSIFKLNKPKLANDAYDLVELLCLLPRTVLAHLADTVQRTGRLPSGDEFFVWIKQHPSEHVWKMTEERARQSCARLVSGYLRYVLRMARNSIGQGVDYLDLVQEGAMGLIRAANRFDYREGARFATFATSWIWQGIERAIADQGRTIRLPVHMHERVQSFQKAIETRTEVDEYNFIEGWLSAVEEDEESENEIIEVGEDSSSSSGVKARRKAYQLFEYCQPLVPLSLELPYTILEQAGLTDEDNVLLGDCMAEQDAEELNERQTEWQHVTQTLRDTNDITLSEYTAEPYVGELHNRLTQWQQGILILLHEASVSDRDSEVVRLRYGLDDGQERTLEEVGEHFALTRERIRQIQSRVLKKLKGVLHKQHLTFDFSKPIQYPLLPEAIEGYIERTFNPRQLDSDNAVERERRFVDRYLMQLPGGDWHAYRTPKSSTRQEQLIAALRVLGVPTHYNVITEQVNDLVGEAQLDENYAYVLLMKYEDVFVRLGEGFFSLAEWERQRTAEAEPVLPFCPAPLPDPPGEPNAFFESVMIAGEVLRTSCDVAHFLYAMTKWAGLTWPQPRWICQGVLSAYYLAGVIPYVFYADSEEQLLPITLPATDLQKLREYCLEALNRRLQAMPEFWWLLQHHQPVRVSELSQLFVNVHPLGLDDVSNRLSFLVGIGAVQKSSYGRYHLTQLGETMAELWGRSPLALEKPLTEIQEIGTWELVDLWFD